MYSLQRYLELLADGQTVALDMLFAPNSAMTGRPHRFGPTVPNYAAAIAALRCKGTRK
jgi:hypothetical protein